MNIQNISRVQRRQQYRSAALCILLLLAVLLPVRAQYSSETFELKKASELYDERGFNKGQTINVDGNMAVSPINGNVSYKYTLDKFTRQGYGFDLSLAYCGSVSMVSFGKYNNGVTIGGPTTADFWQKLTLNRPLWIIGFNGFAVQTFSLVSDYMPPAYSEKTTWSDKEYGMDWLVEGYDVCNRMQWMNDNGDYDIIRLLRADGSLLELRNGYRIGDAEPAPIGINPIHLTGHYFEDAINPTGFAVVDYDTTNLNSKVDSIVTELKAGIYGSSWRNMAGHYLPRVVRYYPGDGLEYVFREHQIPFGLDRYRGDQSITGGMVAGPTIFYLREINDARGSILALNYSHHRNPDDETPGRALLKSISDYVELNYGDNFATVQSRGRTISLRLENSIPFSEYEYRGGDRKYSHIGRIREIRDPENRSTQFTYQRYTRSYYNYNHPYNTADELTTEAYRISRITEPTAQYDLTYYNGTLSDLDAQQSNPYAMGAIDWRLSNVATEVQKRSRSSELLTTETYCYRGIERNWQNNCDGLEQAGTLYSITDHKTGKSKDIDYLIWKREIDRYRGRISPDPLGVPLVHTEITGTAEVADGIRRTTETAFDTVGCRMLILPWRTVTAVANTDSSQTYITSWNKIQYQTDTVRGFTGPDEARRLFTRKATQKKEIVYNPADTTEILIENYTNFLHLPFRGDTLVSEALVVWDKFASLHRYDSLMAIGAINCRWEDMPANLHIYDTITTTGKNPPPFYGLVKEQYSEKDGTYLGGKKMVYNETLNDTVYTRGLLMRDSIISRDRATAVLGNRYTYSTPQYFNDRLPIAIENAYGARKELLYSIPWHVHTGTATAEDSTQTQEALLDRSITLGLEKPATEQQLVRNARTLTTDTLYTVNEYTHYGLVSATRDPNSHYSRFDYDKNGRIRAAWLPRDFFGQDTACTEHYTGALDYPLWGHTAYHIETDSAVCDTLTHTVPVAEATYDGIIIFSPLKAAMYRRASRDCDGGPYPLLSTGSHDERTQDNDNPTTKQPKVLSTGSQHHHIGTITREDDIIRLPFVTTGADNIFAQALTMSKAYFQFYITSMAGNCFTMEVRIIEDTPSAPGDTILTQRYTMNCPALTTLTAFSGGVSGKKGAMDGRILAGPAPLDYQFRVDIKPKFDDIKTAGTAYVEIRVVTSGAAMEIAAEGEDKRPRFVLDGEFDRPHPLSDFTLAYDYAPNDQTVSVRSKTDDKYNTASAYPGDCTYARRSKTEHRLGADHRLEKTFSFIGDPNSPLRTDTIAVTSSGVGLKLRSFDQLRDSVSTEYDAWGRPVKVVNADSTYTTVEYTFGDALSLTGDNDQNFYGYCEKTLSSVYDKAGFVQYKSVQYTDAFGRLRREEIGESLNLITRYEYDEQSRLVAVANPAGDTTRYWYDKFGRVKYKYQPDMGYISYAYDKLGQVRFVQTQQQANDGKLTFTEYDDLGRVTLVGEARLTSDDKFRGHEELPEEMQNGHRGTGSSEQHASLSPVATSTVENSTSPAGKRERTLTFPPHDNSLKLDRLTDLLNATFLHDDGVSTSPTANKTIWLSTVTPPPAMWNSGDLALDSTCVPLVAPADTVFPYLVHPVLEYTDPDLKLSDTADFENISIWPRNARILVHYDEMPTSTGPVWLHFPDRTDWERIAPHRLIRNSKGRETAVAYRQHAGEPYHYVVMSYDERGRVEALLRYTENLGFDAVYYTYNSMNAITSITAADPTRQYTTWYGYNYNGQVDSVWTKLSIAGEGLGVDTLSYPTPQTKPNTADIAYDYTKRGQINTMYYPPISTVVSYAYNHRAFLDSMVAQKSGTMTFRQKLQFDAQGRITEQRTQHSGQTEVLNEYQYDYRGQLANASENRNGITTAQAYEYDLVGNRNSFFLSSWLPVRTEYLYTDPDGPNRLTVKRDSVYQGGAWALQGTSGYLYNADGAMKERSWTNGAQSFSEAFSYDNVQGLLKKYVRTENDVSTDWRYRYSAGGEREQKRQYRTEGVTPAPGELDWTYYLLDGAKRQLAVYEGVVTKQTSCGSSIAEMVYLYPVEYLSYGQGSVHNITTKPVNPTTGEKEYKIQDHLGSTRLIIAESGTVAGQYDYDAWGEVIWQSGQDVRKGFIDKEKDAESGDHNFGVRQYSPENGGRFGSIDVMWEKYRSLSPYQYAGNNPLVMVDPSGMIFGFADQASQTLYQELYNASSAATQAAYDQLSNSGVIYYININANAASFPQTGINGQTSYDFSNDRINIKIEANVPNKVGTLGDELTHAGQFENGELGYINGGITLGFDMEDEIASKRGGIEATNAYNTAYGTNYQLDPSVAAFQQADVTGNPASYFTQNVGGSNYGFQAATPAYPTGGNAPGVHIPATAGYTVQQLEGAVRSPRASNITNFAVRVNGQTIVRP